MKTKKKWIVWILLGASCGFINGFFGGGGGMILVPALIKLLNYEQKQAHATSIAVILPITVASAIVYTVGQSFDGAALISSCIGVFLGGILGALLLKKLSNKWIGYIFCAVMVVAGVRILFF